MAVIRIWFFMLFCLFLSLVHGFTVSSLTVSESGTLTDLDVMNGVKGSSVGVFFIDGLEAIDITASMSHKTFTYAHVG